MTLSPYRPPPLNFSDPHKIGLLDVSDDAKKNYIKKIWTRKFLIFSVISGLETNLSQLNLRKKIEVQEKNLCKKKFLLKII